MRRVSSRQNPVVARFRDLARGRGPAHRVLLEGERLVEEAVAAGVAIDTVVFSERMLASGSNGLVERIVSHSSESLRVPDTVMAALSPVKQPSGIVALAQAGPAPLPEVLRDAPHLVVVLAGIQDAGNVGAIVRAADGCAATGIIAADGTADPFGWKALRGAMGSTFRVPIAARQSLESSVDELKRRGVSVVAAVPRGGAPLPGANLSGSIALLLGGEGAGLSDAIIAAADERITIPMRPPVESFNVAITAALILYEAAKQRASG
jgi:RNA methyltransferase, TrmH family